MGAPRGTIGRLLCMTMNVATNAMRRYTEAFFCERRDACWLVVY